VAPSFRVVEIAFEFSEHRAGARGERGVLQPGAQFLFGNFAQHGHGVVKHILPAARRQLVEEILRLLVPGPPEVAGHFF